MCLADVSILLSTAMSIIVFLSNNSISLLVLEQLVDVNSRPHNQFPHCQNESRRKRVYSLVNLPRELHVSLL